MSAKPKLYLPTADRSVPLEDGRDWPAGETGAPEPTTLPDTLYWRRRVADGDVAEVADKKPAGAAGQTGSAV